MQIKIKYMRKEMYMEDKIIQNKTNDGYIISELLLTDIGNAIIDYKPPYDKIEKEDQI